MWRAVVTQPFDRNCTIDALGAIDADAGEFWVDNPFRMVTEGHNLSAFERNRLFLNVDGSTFLDASFASNADIDSDSRSVVVADFDGDHAPDILVSNAGGGPLRMFRNTFPKTARRIRVKLIGKQSNRSGFGSRVTVECGDVRIVRDAFPANGLMGQSPVELLIGVGNATSIDRLTIRWPTGAEDVFDDVPVDCRLKIKEGKAEPEVQLFQQDDA